MDVIAAKAALKLDPRTYAQALSCVRCGLCLPVCPTYLQTSHEADSPRGRIQLMRGLSDGAIRPTESVLSHLDLCLDCRACETACPSEVVYHELIEETRSRLAARTSQRKKPDDPIVQWFLYHVLPYPRRLKWALLPARLLQHAGIYWTIRRLRLPELLPGPLQEMERLLPESGPLWPRRLPRSISGGGVGAMIAALYRANMQTRTGVRRDQRPQRVVAGFLGGCVGNVLFDRINRQSIKLLASCGIDILIPRAQGCCGAIHLHGGQLEGARALARQNIDAFVPLGGKGVDFIVNNIAGCGAMLQEYAWLLRDDPDYKDRAVEFSRRVRDINQVLNESELPPIKYRVDIAATYHDPCHLIHAQKISDAPRRLLAKIPGLKLVPLTESDVCCGAAGAYNLHQPQMAGELAKRKLDHIDQTGAAVCVTSNVGCMLHLQARATEAAQPIEPWKNGRHPPKEESEIKPPIRVMHVVELLHMAVFGSAGRS